MPQGKAAGLLAACLAAALATTSALAGEPGQTEAPAQGQELLDRLRQGAEQPASSHQAPGSVTVQPGSSTPATAVLYPGGDFMPATVLGPTRGMLPDDIAKQEVALNINDPLSFPDAVRRIGLETGLPTRVEERPSRVAGGAVSHAPPPPVRFAHRGTVVALLDRVATGSGYNWDWDPRTREVVFHRYWDVEQRSPSSTPAGEPGVWVVDPDRHATVKEVMEDWGRLAGWRVDWRTDRDFTVSAYARFVGGFLRATDQILSTDGLRRVLKARVHHGNRWVVVEEAGS